jgi:hypothetical protein
MNDAAVINGSPSVFADVNCCETRAWLRHVRGFTSKGEAIKAVAGQAFHRGMEVYFDPKATTQFDVTAALAALHAVYDPAYARLAAESLEPSLTPTNLHRVAARWFEMHPQHALPWKRVLKVEDAFASRRFQVYKADPEIQEVTSEYTAVKLIVRPDMVVEDNSGGVRWVDTKTTGWRIGDESWRRNLRLSLQAQLYTDAVMQEYPQHAVMGGWFSCVELRVLPGASAPKVKKDGTPAKERLCSEHGRPYAECGSEHAKFEFIECMTTPERLQRALLDAEEAATALVRLHATMDTAKLNMRGTSSGSCRFCPGADFCESGRYPATLDGTSFGLVYEPWDVSEGRRQ